MGSNPARTTKISNNMKYTKTGTNSWTVEVQENGKTKELFIEFPPDCLDQVGWDTGDTLLWEELDTGDYKLTKQEEFPVSHEDTKGTRMDDNYYYFRKEENDGSQEKE